MTIAANLADVESRIARACADAGRPRESVRLLPVSKTWPVSAVRELAGLGYRRFGENRPQELAAKASELAAEGIEFAAIGRLQRNKARIVAEHAAEFQALDDVRLALDLNRRAAEAGRTLDVLVQVNTSDEPQKGGVAPEEVVSFAREVASCEALVVRGLMTLAVFSSDPVVVRPCFRRLVGVQGVLRDEVPDLSWDELSMGMSGDFELAIAEGATCVRVGQAIFGVRG